MFQLDNCFSYEVNLVERKYPRTCKVYVKPRGPERSENPSLVPDQVVITFSQVQLWFKWPTGITINFLMGDSSWAFIGATSLDMCTELHFQSTTLFFALAQIRLIARQTRSVTGADGTF